MDGAQLRAVLLDVVDELSRSAQGPQNQGANLQTALVLDDAARRLNIRRNREEEQALLTFFYDLFRTGYLSWGYDLSNPAPPFCHLTDLGRQALAHHSRDPANPDGYLAYLASKAHIGAVTHSYVSEALQTFNAACFKATAVMIGAAAESVVFDVRDVMVARLRDLGQSGPRDLSDWRVKRVLDAIAHAVTARKGIMPATLFERFEANWPAFSQQIRTARNDAGHAVSVEPVTSDQVHASLLIFPELAALASELRAWIVNDLS